MRDIPGLVATVDQVARVATVSVHGELDPVSYARLRDRLAWVAEAGPRRLVLNLTVADYSAEQLVALVAAAKEQLAPGCLFDLRTAGQLPEHHPPAPSGLPS